MALKHLTTGEMLRLTLSWTKKNHADRQVLAAIPEVEPLLPRIDSAHQALLLTQVVSARPPRLTVIHAEEKALDVRHDEILRGCYLLPQALAYLTSDPSVAKALLSLQSKLLPEGLTATQKSYRDEVGHAAQLKSRLNPADIALLERIKVFDSTLQDLVNEWVRIGTELGKLEDERVAIESSSEAMPADVVAARNRWIRAVNAVRTVIDLTDSVSEALKKIIDRIDDAERRVNRRLASDDDEMIDSAIDVPTDGPPKGSKSG